MFRTRLRAGGLAGCILAVTFAAAFVLVANVDLFLPGLRALPDRLAPVTVRIPYGSIFVVRPAELAYSHQALVLPRGTRARDPAQQARFEAFERSRRPAQEHSGLFVGQFVLFLILGLLLTSQLRRLGARGTLLRTQVATFSLLLLGMMTAKAFLLLTSLPEFLLPVAALPVWMALFIHRRAAILVAPAVAILGASLLSFDVRVLAVLLAQGLVAVSALRDLRHPREIFAACLQAGFVAAAVHVCIVLGFEGHFHVAGDLQRFQSSGILTSLGGGVLSGALALALAPVASRLLGGVSRGRLLELAELDQPLLQKMAAEAPGSFAHARAMANLAEAAAQAIGADALLVRVGAYYHDLGKTVQPKYFIENLEPGEPSPHEELDPDVSADAIMAHVVEGAKILRRGGIPEPVVEFAYTHHGTSAIEFFWIKCQEQGNPKSRTIEHFRYPGMKPQTRETAILMLVDAIEATSRTIQPPTREGFEQAIYRTVYSKLRQTQLDDSGLSLEDIHRVCETLIDTLVNAYHGRIAYPWQKGQPAHDAAAEVAAQEAAPEDGAPVEEAPGAAPIEAPDMARPTVPEPEPEPEPGDTPAPPSRAEP